MRHTSTLSADVRYLAEVRPEFGREMGVKWSEIIEGRKWMSGGQRIERCWNALVSSWCLCL